MRKNITKKTSNLLIFADYFYPSFKAGGPVRSLKYLVGEIKKDLHVSVITRGKDLGDNQYFSGKKIDDWTAEDGFDILYQSSRIRSFVDVIQVLRSIKPDCIYLNSFFSWRYTIFVLLYLFVIGHKNKIIIAPRGELSDGAMRIRSIRKRCYKRLFMIICRRLSVYFHATSEIERSDLIKQLRIGREKIFLLSNVSKKDLTFSVVKCHLNSFRIVFLSRISKKKNLLFLVSLLGRLHQHITLDIIGPVEDQSYWKECLEKIGCLPHFITVNYIGAIRPELVAQLLYNYDLFILPTYSENFGHSILEALSVAVPVIISDQTPWETSPNGAITSLSLDDPRSWINAINRVFNYSREERYKARCEAINLSSKIYIESKSKKASSFFNSLIG